MKENNLLFKMKSNHRIIVSKSRVRLDQYLSFEFPQYSRTKIQNFIKLGKVSVDGIVGKSSQILNGKELIDCSFDDFVNDTAQSQPEKMSIDIIYEDDNIIVINKAPGQVVHPGNGNLNGTLLNGILYHFSHLSNIDIMRPGIIHRLDKETSGAIIIAKDNFTHEKISYQFKQRTVQKEYIAIVWGQLDKKGRIESNIVRDKKKRTLFTTSKTTGRSSLTKYELINYYEPFSILKLYPQTGRTHQIRVHLKSIGHPIVSDISYGGGIQLLKSFHIRHSDKIKKLFNIIKRVALHSYTINIYHPILDKNIKFKAPIPIDMSDAIKLIEDDKI